MQLDAEIARKTKTPSTIFRNLIRNLIKEDWRNYNYKKIMERFADKVLASYGKTNQSHRSSKFHLFFVFFFNERICSKWYKKLYAIRM